MNIQIFDYAVDLLQCVLWQYNQATNLLSLLNQKQAWYDINQSKFWFDSQNQTIGWYNTVFNLTTANAFGLAVWSIILNVPSYIKINEIPNTEIWGFNYFTAPNIPFNSNRNFGIVDATWGNFDNLDTSITLTIEQQRFLLRLRYYQLITNGALAKTDGQTIQDINDFLFYLCETSANLGYSGTIFALDNLDMTITYVFTEVGFPTPLLLAIQQLDVFPRPAGVQYLTEIQISGNFLYLNGGPFTLLNGQTLALL